MRRACGVWPESSFRPSLQRWEGDADDASLFHVHQQRRLHVVGDQILQELASGGGAPHESCCARSVPKRIPSTNGLW